MNKKINQENNFYYMTFTLVVLLISGALVEVIPSGVLEYVLESVTILTFVVCLLSLRFDKRLKRFLFILAMVWVLALVSRRAFNIEQMDLLVLGLMFAFFFGTFKSISRQILFSGKVDSNKIAGSVALFLLLGLMWAIVYLLILEFSPDAFKGVSDQAWGQNFSKMAYFSFVTLTTLGFGDISPTTALAQVVVYMEAIVGVFYMAIVVSSLVSSNLALQAESQHLNRNNKHENGQS